MALQKRTKNCIACGQTKPIIEFLDNKLSYIRTYGKTCASCRAKQANDDDDSGGGKGHSLTLGANERTAAGQQQETNTADIEEAFKDAHEENNQEKEAKDSEHQKESDEKLKDKQNEENSSETQQTESRESTSAEKSNRQGTDGIIASIAGSQMFSDRGNAGTSNTASTIAATNFDTAQTQANETQITQQSDSNEKTQNATQQSTQETTQKTETQRVNQSTMNQGLWWGATSAVATAAKNAGSVGQAPSQSLGNATMFNEADNSAAADAAAEQQAENRASSITPNSSN